LFGQNTRSKKLQREREREREREEEKQTKTERQKERQKDTERHGIDFRKRRWYHSRRRGFRRREDFIINPRENRLLLQRRNGAQEGKIITTCE